MQWTLRRNIKLSRKGNPFIIITMQLYCITITGLQLELHILDDSYIPKVKSKRGTRITVFIDFVWL